MSGPANTIDLVLEAPSPALGPAKAANLYAMPATQGQVRFWSLDQLKPGNPALNMPLMWQCTGPLNVDAMRLAFAECVRRHESLRTTFALIDGKLSQIIHPEMAMPILLDNLTSLSGETQRLEADRITREHAAFRFDLANGPLLALRLLKLGPQRHILLVSMHHVICDGISNGILMRDMLAFYKALVLHTNLDLPELPIQFADYAVWHEDWRRSEEHSAAMQFWRDTLGNDGTPLRLPHDTDAGAALPAHRTGSTGDIETLLVPPDITARAQAFCAREGITLNVLLFSIFNTLLARVTGRNDFTIGSPCANRNEDTEELIGMLMNIQVMRVRLEQQSTFRDLLKQVHSWTLAAVDNQALSFEDLVYDPFFASSRSLEIPIFFLYQKSFMLTQRIESPAGSLQVVPLRSESPGAIFDIMFAVVDREEEGPRLQLEYNPQLYKAVTIQNYLRLFVNILDTAIASPDKAVIDLDILSAGVHLPVPAAYAEDKSLSQQHNDLQDYVAPSDVIERQLAEMWQSILGIPRISVRDSFFSLGAGSLVALRLVTRMNRIFTTDLGLASLITNSTIESIAEIIRNRVSAKSTSSLVPLKADGAEPPLFILHGVGGNIINFYGLSMRIDPSLPVYGVQSQALLAGQPALLRVEDMAAHYIQEIRKIQPHGPYRLLGYSFGGTMALEMAHQLRAAGEVVAPIGMLDARSVHFERAFERELSTQDKVSRRLTRFTGNTSSLSWRNRFSYIADKLCTRVVRISSTLGHKLGLRTLPSFLKSAYDINHAALNHYKLRPYDGKLILFRAAEQDYSGPRDLGWGEIFTQGVEIHDIPGDHERIFLEPSIDILAAELHKAIQQA
jgi:thioesterase domain-containing protein